MAAIASIALLTLGLGVMGRCEIPKGMEKPSVRIEGRNSPS